MVRLSLTLLAAALLQTGSSLPIVEERQNPIPISLPSGFPTDTGFSYHPRPTGFPGHPRPTGTGKPHHHAQPTSASPEPEKRGLPATPEWLRWLPFDRINM
ncbi:hypothetical protein F5Y19DRAFT_474940 [Xylariaceae sp. FL1651]|nr:hypothetical protein F5Y19DRAFT_474940 [Xylariaceae sp. FL1651]